MGLEETSGHSAYLQGPLMKNNGTALGCGFVHGLYLTQIAQWQVRSPWSNLASAQADAQWDGTGDAPTWEARVLQLAGPDFQLVSCDALRPPHPPPP